MREIILYKNLQHVRLCCNFATERTFNQMDKRQSILSTTLRLIVTQGIHATPMSQIAKEAGVAAGTIYHYFPSKEELLSELYGALKREMGQALMINFHSSLPFKEMFHLFWNNLFNYYFHHPYEFEFLELCTYSPLISAEIKQAHMVHYSAVVELLHQGIDTGILRSIPTDLLLTIVHGSVVTAVRFALAHPENAQEITAEICLRSCWNSVITL